MEASTHTGIQGAASQLRTVTTLMDPPSSTEIITNDVAPICVALPGSFEQRWHVPRSRGGVDTVCAGVGGDPHLEEQGEV